MLEASLGRGFEPENGTKEEYFGVDDCIQSDIPASVDLRYNCIIVHIGIPSQRTGGQAGSRAVRPVSDVLG